MYVIDGSKVQEIRESKFMSKYELAKLADISAIALSRIERGTRNAQAKTIRKLAHALDVTPDALLAAETPTVTPKPATMGASLEGDAPERDKSASFLDDVRPISQLTNDELRALKATRSDFNLHADNINGYVENGTGEMTEDERFRIENGLPR